MNERSALPPQVSWHDFCQSSIFQQHLSWEESGKVGVVCLQIENIPNEEEKRAESLASEEKQALR